MAGQLGDGNTANRLTPGGVSGLGGGVIAIAAGFWHSLAVKSDGSVWSWGAGGDGELGNSNGIDSSTPVAATGLTSGVVAVAAGANDSVALKADGSVWGWGYNALGEVGNGTTTSNFYAPVASGLGAGSGVVAIAAGWYHNFALKSDGSVWAWGSNWFGELGTGSTAFTSTTPVPVSSLSSGVAALAAGPFYSLALKADGSVWSWGYNYYGQLGDGTTRARSTPGPVAGLGSGVVAISAGWTHALALKSDGTVWAWGDNSGGYLGDGTTLDSHVPVAVTGLLNVKAISAGGSFSLALKTDGSVVAWGAQYGGELGDSACGTLVAVSGLSTGVIAVAAGSAHGLAIVSAIPPATRTLTCQAPVNQPPGRSGVNQSPSGAGGTRTPRSQTGTSARPRSR